MLQKGIFVPRGVANGFPKILIDKLPTYLVNDYQGTGTQAKYALSTTQGKLDISGNLERSRSLKKRRQEPPVMECKTKSRKICKI